MKKNNGTLSLVKWTVISLLVCAASLVQANTWTRSGSTITDANGWVLKVAAQTINGVAGLSLSIDAVSTKGTPTGVLDLSGTLSDGSNIVEIADYAFRGSSAGTLYSVTLPSTVIRIGGNAFGGQTSITNVTPFLPSSMKIIGLRAFYQCPVRGALDMSSVTNMEAGDAHFRSTAITSLVCNANLTTIRTYAFQGCGSLKSVQLPTNLVTLESYAFANCTTLSNIVSYLPTTVKTIGDQAFISVPAIQAVDLSSVTNLGQQVFRSSGITSVVFNANWALIDSYAFESCSKLGSVQLPSNLRIIGDHAFSSCGSLTNISPALPNTVTNIFALAFNGDPYSGKIQILNSGYRIVNSQLFGSTTKVSEWDLGTGVTNVADYAFDGTPGPCNFYFYGTAPKFGIYIIRSTPAYYCRFFVPRGDAGWSTFIASNVTALSQAELTTYTNRWPGATLPVGGWTPTSCNKQYVVLWTSPATVPKGTAVLFR